MKRTDRTWTLRGRCTVLFCLLAAVPVGLATVVGVRLLASSIDRELDTLAREELEEMRAEIGRDWTVEAFARVAPVLAGHHPNVRMGWRVVDASGSVHDLGDVGALTALDEAPPGDEDVRRFGSSVRVTRMVGVAPAAATLVIDGSRLADVVSNYEWVGLATVGVSLVLAFLLARLFASQLGALLDGIAGRMRSDRDGDFSDLPLEVRPVAVGLREMLDAAQQRANETRCFVAGLAHELRSPIQNLIGQAEVALLQPRTVAVYRDLVENQLEEQHALANAVDNLLMLCAAEDPGHEVLQEDIDLGRELEVRLQHEDRSAALRGVTLEVVRKGSLVLLADRESVVRAVRNAVENALKWSPSGREVTVTLDGTDDRHLIVDVDDAGPGIPEGAREEVFVPFRRGVDPGGGRVGFGLGLAMTRSAAEQQGGGVEVLTAPLGGARIRITLPRHSALPPKNSASVGRDRDRAGA